MKSILDPDFKYVPSVETDIRKTFKRVREEIAQARKAEQAAKVRPINSKGTKNGN